ncbi:hypothetical protein GCM10009681_43440 [Luedemannella helvata]|uniref:Uncharacterized protein n=1 Tax=Luedemannella helvata TaxID=349315 RepID=A0ABP4X4N7_9ACTN
MCSRDFHVVAQASCGGRELVVMQVVSRLNVVDKKRSLRHPVMKGLIEHPHVPEDREPLAAGRIFRIQQNSMREMILAGDDVVAAIKEAGLTGFAFERAWVDPNSPRFSPLDPRTWPKP